MAIELAGNGVEFDAFGAEGGHEPHAFESLIRAQ
jgi:hypothetical protein